MLDQSPDSAAFARSLAFFDSVKTSFSEACRARAALDRHYRIAGLNVLLRFAGEALVPRITPALEHLRCEPASDPDCTINLFDSRSSNVVLPPPPWGADDYRERGEIRGFNNQRIRTVFQVGGNTLQMLDLEENTGLFWVRSEDSVPYWETGSPLRSLLHLWLRTRGVQFLHAAAVGYGDGGVLLVGKGGSGKSTTALACLDSDLKYLSDDYCLVRPGSPSIVHSLYSTGKKNADDVDRLPFLKPFVSNPHRLGEEKAVYFVHRYFPDRVVTVFPLKALLIPRIAEGKGSRLTPAPQSAGLAALAPSTIFQLPGSGAMEFKRLSQVVRNVPCYHLDIGSDPSDPPLRIIELLANLQQQGR